jgi:hypothetical protein
MNRRMMTRKTNPKTHSKKVKVKKKERRLAIHSLQKRK